MDTPTSQVDRVLIAQSAPVSFTPLDDNGEELALSGTVAVDLKDGAGVVLHTGISATLSGNTISATIPAADLVKYDTCTLVWYATYASVEHTWATTLEVCGGFLFSIAQFKAMGIELAALSAAEIREIRRLAEDRMEQECERAFVPRGCRETVRGQGTSGLTLSHREPRTVYALELDGTVWTSDQIDELEKDAGGLLRRPWLGGYRQTWDCGCEVLLHYAYGCDRPPRPVTDAALALARDGAFPDARIPQRALLQVTDYGNFRVGVPNAENPTGIPSVDAVIRSYPRRPLIG